MFAGREALLTFIARYQAWIGAPEAIAAPATRAEQVQRVIDRVQAEEIAMERSRLQINELLRTLSQVAW